MKKYYKKKKNSVVDSNRRIYDNDHSTRKAESFTIQIGAESSTIQIGAESFNQVMNRVE